MAIKLKVVDKFSAVVDMLNGKSVEGFSTEQAIEFINERIAIAEKKNANGNGERRESAPRQMHEITCAACGRVNRVSFLPRDDRPVYCKACFQAMRESR
jgi:CxxC-x17-CxxC domain-containing protein